MAKKIHTIIICDDLVSEEAFLCDYRITLTKAELYAVSEEERLEMYRYYLRSAKVIDVDAKNINI